MTLEETCMTGVLWCGLGLKDGFVPQSCKVEGGGICQNLVGLPGSSCLMLIGFGG